MKTLKNIVMGDDPDWQTGEIVAENSIHLTSGFHGSADEQIHLHIGHIDRTILEPEDYIPDTKNKSQAINNKNNTTNINIENNITIYPNPTNGKFTLFSKQSKIINIQISNISGNIIYSNQNINKYTVNIDISDAEQGIYLMKITDENSISTSKIIKL
jgi:Secretion system C-terminal sorting domain